MKKLMIMGDKHGRNKEAEILYRAAVGKYGIPDVLILLGDAGIFPQCQDFDPWLLDVPHDLWVIDGNHDDHKVLSNLSLPNWGLDPEKHPKLPLWQKMLRQWEYLPRGTVREGMLFIGGARTAEPWNHVEGETWFPGENISYEDQMRVADAIERVGVENIHTVFSHEAPAAFKVHGHHVEEMDGNRRFLQMVLQEVKPERWFFGHHHVKREGTYCGTDWRCVDMVRKENPAEGDIVMLEL